MMKGGEYWKRRFDILEAAQNKSAVQSRDEIEKQFRIAQKELESRIATWYSRFAKNNQITIAEAQQWLNAKELAELKWDVQEYIEHGKQAAVNGAWMKQLENASARFHISRLEALKIQTQQTMEKLFAGQIDTATELMKKTYLEGYYHTIYEAHKGFNVGWDIAAIDENQLRKILAKPWTPDKRTFSDNIWKDKQALLHTVHTQLTQNIILGKPPDASIRQIEKLLGETDKKGARYKAGQLVMTESAYFSNLAQKDAYKELDVEQFEVLETLDSVTCPVCGAMDGKVFPMTDFQIGVSVPPFHPWCRGCTVPYFDDDIGERAARDGNGNVYYVPSDMKYEEWKEKYIVGNMSEIGLTNSPKSAIMDSRGFIAASNGGNVVELSTRFLNKNDPLWLYADNIQPIDGYQDVVCHGDRIGFSWKNAEGVETNVSIKEFSEILKSSPVYNGGPIRLISCETGAEGAIAAEQLANYLGVDVMAPTDVVYVFANGDMKIGRDNSGTWKVFKPKGGH